MNLLTHLFKQRRRDLVSKSLEMLRKRGSTVDRSIVIFGDEDAKNLLHAAKSSQPEVEMVAVEAMGETGQCPHCGTQLNPNVILKQEIQDMLDSLRRNCFKQADEKKRPIKLQLFLEELEQWLEKTGPFEVVIDVQNVTNRWRLQGKNRQQSRLHLTALRCAALQKRFCYVTHKRDVVKMNPYITAGSSIVKSPTGINDDEVTLYVINNAKALNEK